MSESRGFGPCPFSWPSVPTKALGAIRKSCWHALEASSARELNEEREFQRELGKTADHRGGIALLWKIGPDLAAQLESFKKITLSSLKRTSSVDADLLRQPENTFRKEYKNFIIPPAIRRRDPISTVSRCDSTWPESLGRDLTRVPSYPLPRSPNAVPVRQPPFFARFFGPGDHAEAKRGRASVRHSHTGTY